MDQGNSINQDLNELGTFLRGGLTSSRMLPFIFSDAFDNSLFIACLSPLESEKSESICTLKYGCGFIHTMEKRLILNNKSSKDFRFFRFCRK